MEEAQTTRLDQVAAYLERYKGEETIRSVAERADVSHSIVGALFARKSLPKAANLLSIGQALRANIVTLMELAGYLPEGTASVAQGIGDPKVMALAERIDELPSEVRAVVLETLESQLKAVLTLQQVKEVLGRYQDKRGK